MGRNNLAEQKKQELIIIYIIIGISSGRESKEGEIVLRFYFALAMKAAKRVFYIYLIRLHEATARTATAVIIITTVAIDNCRGAVVIFIYIYNQTN